jgi:hypothetical protein
MAKIGRNDPCPCGSGKKYKQCHGPIDAARETEQRQLRRAQDTLLTKVMEAAPQFSDEFAEGIQEFWNGQFTVAEIAELDNLEERGAERFMTWLMFDHRGPDGTTPLERLAADTDALDLSPAEAQLLPTWTNVRLQPYVVTEVHPGQGLSVKGLFDDTTLMIEDQAAARRVESGEVLIVHLTPVGDVWLVAGAAAHLTADTTERVLEWAEIHLNDLRQSRPEASYSDLLRERSAIFNHLVQALPREEKDGTDMQVLQGLIATTRAKMAATANTLLNRDVEESPARLAVPQAASHPATQNEDQPYGDSESASSR